MLGKKSVVIEKKINKVKDVMVKVKKAIEVIVRYKRKKKKKKVIEVIV